ncbi:MAG: HigA family addiction module antidote protein [Gammaproteobacteria bacterium]|nr:HigA family addiction module antidote protein [Gammaproteobacteria bacterium]
MATNLGIYSDLAVPPGMYLTEVTEEMGMSQAELARRMGRPIQAISEIANGIKSITPDTALQLEQVLGVPANIWTGLEAEYQLTMARNEASEQIEQETDLAVRFPYPEIAKLGWVKPIRKRKEKVVELRRFFGVASLHNLQGVHAYAPAFRQSSRSEVSHESLVAWLRGGTMEAEKIDTKPFERAKVRTALQILRHLTLQEPEVFLPKLRQQLADVGIAFVLLPHFPKTYTNGATFWLTPDKAVLMMTIRGSWADIFWFSLFHELGHILLHNKRHTFLEDGFDDPKWKKQEEAADEFAQKTLIPPAPWETFVRARHFSATTIASFADEIDIAPGIVVGRLQHDGLLPLNHHIHRTRYKWTS